MKIASDGTATYEGDENAIRNGRYVKQLDAAAVERIRALFIAADFDKLPDGFDSRLPDLPAVTIKRETERSRKSTTFKENKTPNLAVLHKALQEIANSREGWNPFKPEKSIPVTDAALMNDSSTEDFIVEVAAGNSFANWFSSNKDKYGMVSHRNCSEGNRQCVVSIKTNVRSTEEVVKMLQSDKLVSRITSTK